MLLLTVVPQVHAGGRDELRGVALQMAAVMQGITLQATEVQHGCDVAGNCSAVRVQEVTSRRLLNFVHAETAATCWR
jgi:selenophosphate synthase